MEEKSKEIFSVFLKIPAGQITAATAIDRSALGSSILVHRVYAKLAAAGIVVDNYQEIKTFGALLQQVNKSNAGVAGASTITSTGAMAAEMQGHSAAVVNTKSSLSIGIDIEAVNAMPVTGDFREDAFYTMNFSATEIAYCILQANPYHSFAGLFAAKEAIVKADNTYKNIAFNRINIQHFPEDGPFHQAFSLSISHTNETAVAVAIPKSAYDNSVPAQQPAIQVGQTGSTAGTPATKLLLLISIILSLLAIYLVLSK